MRRGENLVIRKLDRLGRNLKHLIGLVEMLEIMVAGLITMREKIVTTIANGKLIFPIFHSLAEFERGVIREWNNIGLTSANARRATRTAEKKSFVFRKSKFDRIKHV